MFELYTVLLTLHISLVVLWLGAGVTLQVIAHRVATITPEGLPSIAAQLDWFGQKWFPMISGLTGVVGVLLWIDGPWELGTVWLWIAVVGWVISSAVGATQLGPRVARIHETGSPEAVRDFIAIARVDTVLLFLIVADMVIKPFA